MIEAILKYQFLQNAVIACLLASVVCGIIGVIIVEKKLVMMSGGIAHTAYGGVGLGYLLGFEPLLGAMGFSILAALGIGFVKRKGGTAANVIIALFWSLGMSLGIIFVSMMKGYPPDMSSYLFGNILMVQGKDLILMAVTTVVVALTVAIFYNDWKAFLFDSEFAAIGGMKTTVFEYLLLVLVALTVVVLIRVAGIVLILALLTAPAATAGLISRSFKGRMLLSVGLSALFCLGGLWISYLLDIPSGAVIVVLASVVYAVVFSIKLISRRLRA